MAKKKTRRKSRRKQQPIIKSWLLLLSGILIGLFAALLVFLNHQLPVKAPPVAETKPKRPSAEIKKAPAEAEEIASKYDFYGALPSSRVVVPHSDDSAAGRTIIIQHEKEFSANYTSYMIQVGSFKNTSGADQQKAALAILGYEPSIEKTRLHDGNIVHRVLLGPFSDINSVNQLRTKLQSQKIESTLLKSE